MRNTVKLSKSSIARIPFSESKPSYYPDSEIIGLKLKVGKRRKTFVLEKRIKGHKGSAVTFSLGSFPLMTVNEARQKARLFANLCEQGQDPRKSSAPAAKRVITLKEGAEKFFSVSKHLSTKSIITYRGHLKHQFGDWLDRDMCEITVDDVVEKYYELVSQYVTQSRQAMTFLSVLWDKVSPLMRENRKRLLPVNPVPEARKFVGGWVKPNPDRKVVPLRKLGHWIETMEFLRHDPSQRDSVRMTCELLLLAMSCGLRNKECRTLQWSNVDLELGSITITREIAKNKQKHFVALSNQARSLLIEINSKRCTLSPYVWPTPITREDDPYKPIGRRDDALKIISDALGYHFRPHTTRRTFSSIANHIEIPWLILKRMLNHKYKGGVTGGYIVPEFDPTHNRKYFQMISDFLYERRHEYLSSQHDSLE